MQLFATAVSSTWRPCAPAGTESGHAAPIGAYVPTVRPKYTVTSAACAGGAVAATAPSAATSRRIFMVPPSGCRDGAGEGERPPHDGRRGLGGGVDVGAQR